MNLKPAPFIALLALLISFSAAAQPAFIADAGWQLQGKDVSLYSLLDAGRPVLFVTGNIHTAAADELLRTCCLQKLSREHGPKGASGVDSGADGTLYIVFLNIVPDATADAPLPRVSFPVITVAEDAPILKRLGWNSLYRPHSVSMAVAMPDHLLYPVSGDHAADIYTQVNQYAAHHKPTTDPDARLLDVHFARQNRIIAVTFQNYSTRPLQRVSLCVWLGRHCIAIKKLQGNLSALNTVAVSLPLLQDTGDKPLRVVLQTAGDADLTNNEWVISPGIIAGTIRLTAENALVKINCSSRLPGQTDTLQLGTYMPQQQLGVLHLKWAHAPSSCFDKSSLQLIYSDDEGRTWQAFQTLTPEVFATAAQQSYTYHPAAGDWKSADFYLPQANAKHTRMLAVVSVADWTNDAYLADIRIQERALATAGK